MEKQEKAFILNKGLILGLVLMLFPIIDLLYGLDMNWKNYLLIFGLLWMVVYSYLVVKWSKEFASYYEIFPFKDAFRTLFLISALAFGVITVGKIAIWNIYSPEKYTEINLKRAQLQLTAYELSNDNIEPVSQPTILRDVVNYWSDLQKNGIPKTHFIFLLIQVLFINSIYCAILALFVRKKEKFIKTN